MPAFALNVIRGSRSWQSETAGHFQSPWCLVHKQVLRGGSGREVGGGLGGGATPSTNSSDGEARAEQWEAESPRRGGGGGKESAKVNGPG